MCRNFQLNYSYLHDKKSAALPNSPALYRETAIPVSWQATRPFCHILHSDESSGTKILSLMRINIIKISDRYKTTKNHKMISWFQQFYSGFTSRLFGVMTLEHPSVNQKVFPLIFSEFLWSVTFCSIPQNKSCSLHSVCRKWVNTRSSKTLKY